MISARVVGAGSIGTRYLRCLASLGGPRPISVPVGGVLRDLTLTELVRLESFNEIGRPRVDLCVIATNTDRHLEDSSRFRDSADVQLIEKPLSHSTESLRGFDLTLPAHHAAVATPLRFMDGFAEVQGLLSSLGEILGVSVECRSWLPSWRPGTDFQSSYSADPIQGGVLLDLVHEVDYCLRLFGPPSKLAASLNHDSVLGIASESTAHVLWRYRGYDLHMVLDYVSRPPSRGLTIYGTMKSVSWDILKGTLSVWDHTLESVEISNFPKDLDRNLVLMRQISATAAGNGDPRVSSLAEGWQAVAVCDLAKESSHKSGILLEADGLARIPSAG